MTMKFFRYFFLFIFLLPSFGCKAKPSVQWTAYSPEAMSSALHSGQPTLVYFYAAWCGACMELKHKTFSDPAVIEALNSFQRIKGDMSFNHSPKVQKMADEFDIRGLPTLIFYDSKGNVEGRFMGYQPAGEFLEIVNQFKTKYGIVSPASAAVPIKKARHEFQRDL
jgi:thiol:disulfide interchange protein